eukprot:SAG31_NODE_335_length_17509_cov_7.127972_5_plen_125_part_00
MVRDRVDGGGDGRAWRSAVRKLRSEGAVGVCALVHLPVPRAAPVGQWMGNAACGSNVKDKLEAGKLYLHVQGFPDPLAPIGDVDSPFGIDMAIPVRASFWIRFASNERAYIYPRNDPFLIYICI